MAYTNADWAATVLADAGLPVTQNNVGNLMRWMTAEEPTSNWFDRNNPLNASLGTSASDGTGSYTDLNTGASYTAQMLKQSNMAGIYEALASNASPNDFSSAVVASPWASGHYGGNPLAIAGIPVPSGVNAPTTQSPGQSGVAPAGGTNGAAGAAVGGYGGISLPIIGQVISGQQEMDIKGWLFIIAGAGVAVVGMAVLLTTFGLESRVGKIAAGATIFGKAAGAGGAAAGAVEGAQAPTPPSPAKAFQAGQSQATDRDLTSAYNRGREDAGEPIRYPSRQRPRPGSRESRERAAQPF